MGNKQKNANFQLELNDGGLLARRKTQLLSDGAYLFEDELEVDGVLTAQVITCAAWLLELYELQAGEIFFMRGDAKVRPETGRFGVFYSPFSISQLCFKNVIGHLTGVAATEILPAEFLFAPSLFDATFTEPLTGVAQVIETLQAGKNRQPIEINPKASLLSRKAKKLIDENYLIYPSIARIAVRLGVTPAHLSRQFKHDFGMSPSNYFRLLRVADVPLRLAKGEEIINVSQDVGYNDLSRFYKQFRKTTNTSPGACKTMMRPTSTSYRTRK